MNIQVSDLRFAYGERQVLRGISFGVPRGCLCSILGANGAGKSTMFRCMLGLERGYSGSIVIGGDDVRTLSSRTLARRIAYIPQSHYPAFNYPVIDMVLMGTSARGRGFAQPGRKEEAAAMEALERLGMADFAARDYFRLSGGERQLVLIARALAQQSGILVLDEPTASLDFGHQLIVMRCLRDLTRQGYTVIQSTHSPEQAYMFSDMLLAMHGGEMIAQGAPKDVLTREVTSRIYGVKTQVLSLEGDAVRVCVADEQIRMEDE